PSRTSKPFGFRGGRNRMSQDQFDLTDQRCADSLVRVKVASTEHTRGQGCPRSQQNWLFLVIALVLMASAAALLNQLHTHQRLGLPGVKTSPIPGSIRLQVELPPRVLDYDSQPL